jgi:hypothetical protein
MVVVVVQFGRRSIGFTLRVPLENGDPGRTHRNAQRLLITADNVE